MANQLRVIASYWLESVQTWVFDDPAADRGLAVSGVVPLFRAGARGAVREGRAITALKRPASGLVVAFRRSDRLVGPAAREA